MEVARWQLISGILDQALELEGAAREALLAEACAGDTALRREVDALLAREAAVPPWLARPAALSGLLTATAVAGEGNATDRRLGERLGAFRLMRVLGRGGMGTVYLAERVDGQFEQTAAIKLVRPGHDSERLLAAFRRERQILARLEHPHIARLLDGGLTTDGVPYFVMEHVEGEPITDYCARHEPSIEARLELFLAVCSAVTAAHHNQVIHRDLKPSNVLVSTSGEVKLLDFGIAKLLDADDADRTRTGTVALTPLYAAPEQVRGGAVSEATDVHALGLLLYELLTGQRARRLGRDTPEELMRVILDQEPERPSAAFTARQGETAGASTTTRTGDGLRRRLRGDLDTIVLKALQKEPARRYPTVEALAADLRRHLAGLPITARPGSLAYRIGKLARRRTAVLAVGAVAAAALAITAAALLHARRLEQRRPEAPLRFQLVSTTPGLHRAPSFSPDGKRIAYVDFTRGVPQLWVKDLAGGSPRQLTHGDAAVDRPRWSPRGDVILFARSRQGLWTVPVAGGEPRRIVERGFSPNYSADGQKIVFERSGGRIVIADADGRHQREVAGVPKADHAYFTDMSPALSADGRRIAFFRCENGPTGDLWVMSAAGGEARQLTHDLRPGGEPVWTPDGESIIFSSMRGGSRTLWRIAAGGGTPVPITTGSGEDSGPSLDATGRRLIYTNAQDGSALTVFDPATGSERALLEQRSDIDFPEPSPDGSKIVFFSPTDAGIHIFTVRSDGSDLRQVTTGSGEFNYFPHWSGDGRSLYYFQYLPRRGLRRIGADGGKSVEIHPEWDVHSGGSVDPGDRLVAYQVGKPWHPTATRIRELAGGEKSVLAKPLLGFMRWSPDGRALLGFTEEREIAICDVATGACRAIAEKAHSPVWSDDGRRVFFLRGPQPLEDPTVVSVTVWSVGADGSDERLVTELAPIVVFGKSLALLPGGEILWTKYVRGPHQLWIADLP